MSPVFDVARLLRVFELEDRRVTADTTLKVRVGAGPDAVIELGVDVLICSAISTASVSMLRLAGIEVIPGICGAPERAVAAYAAGDAVLSEFRAPGLRAARRGRAVPASNRGRRGQEAKR